MFLADQFNNNELVSKTTAIYTRQVGGTWFRETYFNSLLLFLFSSSRQTTARGLATSVLKKETTTPIGTLVLGRTLRCSLMTSPAAITIKQVYCIFLNLQYVTLQIESQNVKEKGECSVTQYNNAEACKSHQGTWTTSKHGIAPPYVVSCFRNFSSK